MITRDKTLKIGLICVLIVMVLGVGAYFERSWVRASAIPAYVSFVYKPRVDKTFKESFSPINEKLAVYGFEPDQTQADSCSTGLGVYYEGFNETIGCTKQTTLKLPGFSKAVAARWESGSPGLARYLESDGWNKLSRTQALPDLLTDRGGDSILNVSYGKSKEKIRCELMIVYYPWENDSDKAWAQESCTRNFVIFKGSGPGGTL